MDKIGKYEVLEKIGTGGFGVVFKGYDPFIKRPVAIKTCFSADETIRGRFFREAEIAGRLQHRNITAIYDTGFHQDVPFLVVEYLTGEDLRAKIKRRDDLQLETRLEYLIEVARGLEYAHSENVVHRDIKPANIRVLDDDSVKIMDFGTARFTEVESSLTQTGVTVGTVAYLSPEQIEGKTLTTNSDIFAFGILAYELIAYERPFGGKKISEIILQILESNPRRLSSLIPSSPPALESAIHRCLERDPTTRYQSCTPLISDFQAILASLRGDVVASLPESARTSLVVPQSTGPSVEELLSDARPLLEKRDYARAEVLLRQALSMEPDHDDAISLQRALEADRREQTEAGRRKQGIEEAISSVEVLIDRNDLERAEKTLEFATDLFGDFDEVQALRTRIDSTRETLEKEAIQQRRLKVSALLTEANLRLKQLLADDARRHLLQILRLDPQNVEAKRLLTDAETLLAQGSSPREAAIREAQQSIESVLDRGDYDQAEKALEFARHRLGDFPQARELRNRIAAKKQEATRPSQSVDTLEDVDSFIFLARELLQIGETIGARRALKRVLRLNPEHAGARVLLQEIRDRSGA